MKGKKVVFFTFIFLVLSIVINYLDVFWCLAWDGVVVLIEKWIVQVEGKIFIRLDRGNDLKNWELTVGCNAPGKWILHWGVSHVDDIGRYVMLNKVFLFYFHSNLEIPGDCKFCLKLL